MTFHTPYYPPPPRRPPIVWIAIGCFVLGGGVGFGAGVLSVKSAREFASGMFQSERRAEVGDPKTIDRPAFRFQHAGNWKIDDADSDYDPDHMFSVDSPGQSFIMFFVADGDVSPKTALDEQVSAQTAKVMKQATRTRFTTWGAYTGEGTLLAGKHLGITPGTIRIFCFRARERTFTVIESTYDDDRANVQPGFDLIARSFHVKDE